MFHKWFEVFYSDLFASIVSFNDFIRAPTRAFYITYHQVVNSLNIYYLGLTPVCLFLRLCLMNTVWGAFGSQTL